MHLQKNSKYIKIYKISFSSFVQKVILSLNHHKEIKIINILYTCEWIVLYKCIEQSSLYIKYILYYFKPSGQNFLRNI